MKLQDRKASTLGFGMMGGGHTVWDSARQRNNDYLKVAHISFAGRVEYTAKISNEQKIAIEGYADTIRKEKGELFKYRITYVKSGKVFGETILASDWSEAKDICKSKGDFVACINIS